ncbi:MAG: immunoglobulin-like domain-containing protein [Flavisolibacter sp.]|jgi:hypothetical protein
MLQKINFSLLLFIVMLVVGCKKETTKDVSTTLKVPIIELNGSEFVSVAVGGTYTDAGAKYTGEDGSVTTIQPTTNTVNTSQPGLYTVTYSKTSTSGIFTTEESRIVAVSYQNDPYDYSGNYLRPATGASAILTKVAPGLYKVQNPGGAVGHEAAVVYFIETDLNTFDGPTQEETSLGVGTITITNITLTTSGGSWKIVNPYYGTALRTFVKQ